MSAYEEEPRGAEEDNDEPLPTPKPQQVYSWVDANIHSPIPANAVRCSADLDRSDVYLGRVHHENYLLAAKIVPRRREAYAAFRGKELHKGNFQYLVSSLNQTHVWESGSNGSIPAHAVQCGYNKDGYKLYVGRTAYGSLTVPGYVHPHFKFIYFPFDGKELKNTSYEVLVNKPV